MKILTELTDPVRYLKGVGPQKAMLLKKIGIEKISDLLQYYPRSYEDRRNLKPIAQVVDGETEIIQGKILATSLFKKKGLTIFKVALADTGGIIYAVWYNQDYLKKILVKGKELVLTGKVEFGFGERQIKVSEYELLRGKEKDLIYTKRIVPIYGLTENLYINFLRSLIKRVIDEYTSSLTDLLPLKIREKYKLKEFSESLKTIHFPKDFFTLGEARKRLVFEEFFFLQVGLALKKKDVENKKKGVRYSLPPELEQKFIGMLPFVLTKAQKKVVEEIKKDLRSSKLMNRLLQGDVGSGKTVVAVLTLLMVIENGYQAVLMVPTEILAEQHFLNLHKLLNRLGVKIDLLIGSLKSKEKQEILKRIRQGETAVLIGTHTLIQESVNFYKLGLVIIDEQHLFGVIQRAKLRQKGLNPDVLVMTATPIPRTLSLTVYGDLDVSIIDELPSGRGSLETCWVGENKRPRIYKFLHKEVEKGRQVYIVYPLIEKSEKMELKAASEMFKKFQKEIFPDLKIGLIHGRMEGKEKERIMESFQYKRLDILISTTVIGVGIDVPNVSVILIEHAERFGLAQLHQLRGRVGRGPYKSYCILLTEPKTEESKERMKVMVQTNDGFLIAEKDLELRGPGEFFGARQHGLPDLKIANIVRDRELLEIAREEAFNLVSSDPELVKEEHQLIKKSLISNYKEKMDLIRVS